MTTTLFGHKCSAPIGFAPIGINKTYHANGELPVAKVAGGLRLPYSLSTAGSTATEDVAASNDEGARLPSAVKVDGGDDEPMRFFQLYMPVFKKRLAAAGVAPEKQLEEAGAMWIDNVWHGHAWSWEKIPWLIETWKRISGGRPFLLKGIQNVGDARKAIEVGCDGIVVSNRAGRQVDGAIASLDTLENIINAGIEEKIVVTFDSGVRGAS